LVDRFKKTASNREGAVVYAVLCSKMEKNNNQYSYYLYPLLFIIIIMTAQIVLY